MYTPKWTEIRDLKRYLYPFFSKWEIILEINSTPQQWMAFQVPQLCQQFLSLRQAQKVTETWNSKKSLRDLAKSTTHIRQIHLSPPIHIQIDHDKPVPNIKQCPLNPEALARIQQIIQEYKTQDLIVPCTGLCNIPILPIEKSQGGEWRFAQDLKAIHNTVINCYPVTLDLHALLWQFLQSSFSP